MKKILSITAIIGLALCSVQAQDYAYANTDPKVEKSQEEEVTKKKNDVKEAEDTKVAPQKLAHTKKSLIKEDNTIYWPLSMPAYLHISSSPDEEGYRMQKTRTKEMEKFAEPMYFDGHGVHYIKHSDLEHELREHEVSFEIHVDGYAPSTHVSLTGAPRYQTNGVTYYGEGLELNVKASDEMSGVEGTYHSLNGAAYTAFETAPSLTEEKEYQYRYYSVDNVGNAENEHTKSFTLDLSAPKTDITVKGKHLDNIMSPTSFFTLKAEDELSGVRSVYFGFDGDATKQYQESLWFSYLADGEHTFTYYAKDQVSNKEEQIEYSFYLDKTAPVITSEFEGDHYQKGGLAFISGSTKVMLKGDDNKAGVDKIYYIANNEAIQEYTAPFIISEQHGNHKVLARGVDKVGNKGSFKADENLSNIYIDKAGPKLSHYYTGKNYFSRDTMFITSESKVHLKAVDYEAGLKEITYSLEKNSEELVYEKGFKVADDGFNKVTYKGADNVNNTTEDDFFFIVDNEGPEIFYHFSLNAIGEATMEDAKNPIPIHATNSDLFLAATDKMVGTDKIYYTLDGGKERLYTGAIKTMRKGLRSLTIRTVDYLGNESVEENIEFFIK